MAKSHRLNNEFDEDFGGFVPRKVLRQKKLKQQQENAQMGLGPRRKNSDFRDRQGKMVGQNVVASPNGTGLTNRPGVKSDHDAVRQNFQTGKKYSGPNYKQKDQGVSNSGGK